MYLVRPFCWQYLPQPTYTLKKPVGKYIEKQINNSRAYTYEMSFLPLLAKTDKTNILPKSTLKHWVIMYLKMIKSAFL